MSKYETLFRKLRSGLKGEGGIVHGSSFIMGLIIGSLEYTNDKKYDEPRPLSRIVQYGKGRSQHFAMLYYVLAKEAGIEVMIDYGRLYNSSPRIVREIKDKITNHYWCRVNLGKRWIRVDPTAHLIESTPKKTEIFAGHYIRIGSCKLDNEDNPTKLILLE
jgi:hypothetical protein